MMPRVAEVRHLQPVRTHEQIIAQLEARYVEMEAEAAKPSRKFPCQTCRYHSLRWKNLKEGQQCHHPLVMGIDAEPLWAWDEKKYKSREAALCGPEKALWEPHPVWQQYLPEGAGLLWLGALVVFFATWCFITIGYWLFAA